MLGAVGSTLLLETWSSPSSSNSPPTCARSHCLCRPNKETCVGIFRVLYSRTSLCVSYQVPRSPRCPHPRCAGLGWPYARADPTFQHSPMAQRVTLRKRQPYNTTSNRRRVVKTPGGKLVYHHLKKLGTAPKCGDCGIALPGVRLLYSPMSQLKRLIHVFWLDPCPSTARVFQNIQAPENGASGVWWLEVRRLCQVSVRGLANLSTRSSDVEPTTTHRILRAFLVEEAKIVKKVIKSQQKTPAKK